MALVRWGLALFVARPEDAGRDAPSKPGPPELTPEESIAWNEMIEKSRALTACWVFRGAAVAERQLERWRARERRGASARSDPGRHESGEPVSGLPSDRLKTRRLPR